MGAHLAAVDTQAPTRLSVQGQRCSTMAGLDDPDGDFMQEDFEDFEEQGPEDVIMEVVSDPAPMESVVLADVPNNGHANHDEMSPPGTPVSLQQAVHEHSASGDDTA